jgi:hypothetical protein
MSVFGAHTRPNTSEPGLSRSTSFSEIKASGAYALGTGGKRKIWVFRLSVLAASVVRNAAIQTVK